jgi:ketosteroid isomerase-like protein
MSLPIRTIVFAGFLSTAGAAAAATPAPDVEGVRAAENRWSEAFVTGDVATLDALLDADYVSVNAAGQPRAKAEILQLAHDFAKAHPGQHGQPLAATSTIRVLGDAAVVQHHGSQDTSVDVFYFRDGRWHAWYSQHTRRGG